MKAVLLICFIFINFQCSTRTEKGLKIEIVIEHSQSFKYDLNLGVFTVFYLDKPPTKIKFTLSVDEKNAILNKYYEWNINEISESIAIPDKCMVMPKLFTKLIIKSKNKIIEIEIDEECNNYGILNNSKAKRIKKFLELIYEIVRNKKEIQNAPESDIFYI